MNSSVICLSDILNKAKILYTAGFSQGYSFNYEKADVYFDELIANSVSPSPIFSGILILEKTDDKYTIIDGLQRITTVCLLLCALCEIYKGTSEKNEEAKNKIMERFLLAETKDKPKLNLEKTEADIYKKIIFSMNLTEEETSSNMFQTFQAFLRKIEEQKITGTELFRIISKMQFMVVITAKSEIAVRDLYQALNENKGLSQVNLITDFILQQDSSVKDTWIKMIESFNGSDYLLESFLHDFLITRADENTPNNISIYNNFKNYFYTIIKYQDVKTITDNIYKYSKYYLKLIHANFENIQIKSQVEMLNRNDGKDTYPYLMEVLDDLENGHIDIDALTNILIMINSFIQKQQENSVNIDFYSLSKELNKMLILKDYIPEMFIENKITINELNNLATFEV